MNLYDEIRAISVQYSNRPALRMMEHDGTFTTLSYAEMIGQADQLADQLTELGMVEGDRIVICADTSPSWTIAFLAVAKLRATSVLPDASLTAPEILHAINTGLPHGLILSDNVAEKLDSEMPEEMKQLPRLVGADFTIAERGHRPDHDPALANPDAATLIFSSGTTRVAKAIVHSHDSFIRTAQNTIELIGLVKEDRYLGILPNSHIYGFLTQFLGPMLTGAEVCFLPHLSAQTLGKVFHAYKPTLLPGVPKVYEILYRSIQSKILASKVRARLFAILFFLSFHVRRLTGIRIGKLLLGSVRRGLGGDLEHLCCAGAPLDPKVNRFFFGCGFNILVTYGATETNVPTIGNYGRFVSTDSIGRPYPEIEIRVTPESELLVRSPFRMLGYFNDPENTESAYLEGDWFRSGDLAKIRSDGRVEILGRLKDNIVLATGKKVAPDDIEAFYRGIHGVEELVICGVQHEGAGYDEVHAFVVPESGLADQVLEQLKVRSRQAQASMRLLKIHVLKAIPRTSLEKPKRFLLRKFVQEGHLEEEADTDIPLDEEVHVSH